MTGKMICNIERERAMRALEGRLLIVIQPVALKVSLLFHFILAFSALVHHLGRFCFGWWSWRKRRSGRWMRFLHMFHQTAALLSFVLAITAGVDSNPVSTVGGIKPLFILNKKGNLATNKLIKVYR